MKILILSSLGSDSGCYLRAVYVARSLRNEGHEVRIVRPPKAWPFMLDLLATLAGYFFIVLFSRADFLFAIKPYPNTLWPFLIKRALSRKIRVGVDIDDIDFGYRKGVLPLVARVLQKPFPRFCDIVTCHNDNLFTFIQEEFKVPAGRIWRLDQGVDFTVFDGKPAAKKAESDKFIAEHGLARGRIFVYTAHLNIASDLDDILSAFKIAWLKDSALRLVVAGGGPMFGHFTRLAAGMGLGRSVVFTDYAPPEKIRDFIRLADHCLVYYKERPVNRYRTSMKIREYLAMSKSVVANDVGDLAEFGRFVIRSRTGVEEYAKAILSASRKKAVPNTAGRKYIEQNYDWAVIGRNFSGKIKTLF